MGFSEMVDGASRRAPLIIGAAVVAAVAGAWWNAPHWPFYALTIALLPLALVIWGRRGLARQLKSKEQLGFRRNRHWLGFELFAKGTPRGYFALAFLSWFAVVLTGFRFPYAAVAIVGMLLTIAWGEDRRRYPSELEKR
jgi:Flp pilus assembly protein TadB